MAARAVGQSYTHICTTDLITSCGRNLSISLLSFGHGEGTAMPGLDRRSPGTYAPLNARMVLTCYILCMYLHHRKISLVDRGSEKGVERISSPSFASCGITKRLSQRAPSQSSIGYTYMYVHAFQILHHVWYGIPYLHAPRVHVVSGRWDSWDCFDRPQSPGTALGIGHLDS